MSLSLSQLFTVELMPPERWSVLGSVGSDPSLQTTVQAHQWRVRLTQPSQGLYQNYGYIYTSMCWPWLFNLWFLFWRSAWAVTFPEVYHMELFQTVCSALSPHAHFVPQVITFCFCQTAVIWNPNPYLLLKIHLPCLYAKYNQCKVVSSFSDPVTNIRAQVLHPGNQDN